MTLVVAGLVVLLALPAGSWLAGAGAAAARRERARLAADAAALAAVAESAPYGSSQPLAVARRFAAANGARLVMCRCEPGATEVAVGVTVAGSAAVAAAAIDPAGFAPSDPVSGLDPRLAGAVQTLIAASGGAVQVVSGARTRAQQEALWHAAVARYGSAEAADDWVAPPGTSMHEKGLAVDLGGDVELAARLAERLGLPLHRPLVNEPWHFELVAP